LERGHKFVCAEQQIRRIGNNFIFAKCCLQSKSRLFIKDAHGLAIPKQFNQEEAESDDGG